MKTSKQEEFWNKVDKHGVSRKERFIEPLLVHIKELMPNSDQEVDIETPMMDFVDQTLHQEYEEGYRDSAKRHRLREKELLKMERESVIEEIREGVKHKVLAAPRFGKSDVFHKRLDKYLTTLKQT